MKLNSLVAFSAAALFAGAVLSHDIAEAHGGGGGGHGGGGHGGGGHFGGGHGWGGHGGGHASRSYSLGRNYFYSPQYGESRQFEGTIPNRGWVSTLGVKRDQQLKQASLGKANLFYEQKVSGRNWYKDRRWDKAYDWRRGPDGHWYGRRFYRHVFWPYFFGDDFCYGFWPDYCDDVFWGYGPDVLLWDSFWPDSDFEDDDGAVYASDVYAPYSQPAAKTEPEANAAQESCAGFAPGVGALPVDNLEGIIGADAEQRDALSDLNAAVAKAAAVLKEACPSETPLTPVARLDAMEKRLQAMVKANELVKDSFVRFYSLLSDGQKQRLQAVSGPSARRQLAAQAKERGVKRLCSSQAAFTEVPAEQIAKGVTLTNEQKQELAKIKAAAAKATDDLAASCPDSTPSTPAGRLDAAQKRLSALVQAVNTVRPAVQGFYASLTDEQKAALIVTPKQRTAGGAHHSVF